MLKRIFPFLEWRSAALATPASAPPEPATTKPQAARPGADSALREIVESVVIAFVLAFLFRTFEAEAFVIPTGSMAPTLMGRHKDVFCEKCGCPYQVSASSEVNPDTNQPKKNVFVVAGTCPNCRYTMDDLGPEDQPGNQTPSYKGDRILVGKFAYDYADPKRWDVAVFKWPGGAEINYIKRVVGLPEETIKIRHGDIFVRPKGQSEFTIARKPPEKLEAMLQAVYDNDYVPTELMRQGWPARWSPTPGSPGSAGQWQSSADQRSFHTDGSCQEAAWLRYQHFVPSSEDWQDAARGRSFATQAIRPQLISDFVAYNTEVLPNEYPSNKFPDWLGLHWVGDLAVEGVLEIENSQGQVLWELVKGGRRFRCQIDVATGQAELSIDGQEGYRPIALTEIRGPGKYHVRFANADEKLYLWVNESPVAFVEETSYPSLGNELPTRADLEPVRLGSRGVALGLSHLKLRRDLYYIAVRGNRTLSEFPPNRPYYQSMAPQRVAQFLSEPQEWDAFRGRQEVEFPLGEDQFLMLGDNSAQSSDSRMWESRHFDYFVRRELLIGRASFVYWPHSWDRIVGTNLWCPMFPNFARMKFVR